MPRYYFHVSTEGQLFWDNQGAQLNQLGEAHAYGVKLQRRLAEYSDEYQDVLVKVADEVGKIKLILLPWRYTNSSSFIWR